MAKKMKKSKKIEPICHNFLCPKNIVVGLTIVVVIILLTFSYASITNLTHIYEHESDECHINGECKTGYFCYKECNEFNEDGMCLSQIEIGYCTKTCNTGMDCGSGKCEPRLLWETNAGQEIMLCLK